MQTPAPPIAAYSTDSGRARPQPVLAACSPVYRPSGYPRSERARGTLVRPVVAVTVVYRVGGRLQSSVRIRGECRQAASPAPASYQAKKYKAGFRLYTDSITVHVRTDRGLGCDGDCQHRDSSQHCPNWISIMWIHVCGYSYISGHQLYTSLSRSAALRETNNLSVSVLQYCGVR